MSDELRSNLPDADMQAAPRALLRAAKRAREIARQTGTPLVIVRDGVLVEEWVTDDEDVELPPHS
jgi:F420-dependent methylenetetrahydromethanopterin dehydrogenase